MSELETVRALLEQFSKHIDNRLDRLESTISIIANDNRDNSKKLAEHQVMIIQNSKDIDNLGTAFRKQIEDISRTIIDRENQCSTHNTNQHKTIFDKLDEQQRKNEEQEKQFAFYKGALVVIGSIPTIIGIISLIKK